MVFHGQYRVCGAAQTGQHPAHGSSNTLYRHEVPFWQAVILHDLQLAVSHVAQLSPPCPAFPNLAQLSLPCPVFPTLPSFPYLGCTGLPIQCLISGGIGREETLSVARYPRLRMWQGWEGRGFGSSLANLVVTHNRPAIVHARSAQAPRPAQTGAHHNSAQTAPKHVHDHFLD
jgi:hypothetical protein